MGIRIDKGACSQVIVCTEHTFWAAIRFDMAEAHECAENHETLLHPGEDNAGRAARLWRQRHAADS